MKKIATLTAAALLAAACVLPLHAQDATALKGTPKIDGVLDDIYTQSGTMVTNDTMYVWNWGGENPKGNASAVSYFLHDDSYVYICTVAKDETLIDTGVLEGWKADGVEHWYIDNNGAKTHVSFDAFGNTVYGDPNANSFNTVKTAATKNGDTYTVEMAIPLDAFQVTDGSVLMSIQVNDCFAADGNDGQAWGSQAADSKLVLSDTAVKVEETTAPVDTTAPADDTASVATADMGIVASAIALAASALVVFKKKH